MQIPKKVTPELAEETGLHIGDGSMNFYNERGLYQLRGHRLDDRNHYDIRIKPLYKLLYGVELSLRDMKSMGVYGFQIWSTKLVTFKNKLGLPLGKKLEIKIPKIFLTKKSFKTSVLRGIFDTDGCIYLEKKNRKLYPRIEFKTTSFTLSEQIKGVLLSLGLRATNYAFERKEKNWNTLHTVSLRGENMLRAFINTIEPANPKHLSKFNYYILNS